MQERIAVVLDGLADSARPAGTKRLSGHELYRLRVGDYRVVWQVDDRARTVAVVLLGHRRDVYRGLEHG